jgi:hypothetical protein
MTLFSRPPVRYATQLFVKKTLAFPGRV